MKKIPSSSAMSLEAGDARVPDKRRRPMRPQLFAIAAALALVACAAETPDEDDADAVESANTGRRATRLSELEYGALSEMSGRFSGTPLWVSNNPEDVRGFGLLSSTRPPARASSARSAVSGAPLPNLMTMDEGRLRAAQSGCPAGEVRSLDVYLAHILSSSHLRGTRRLSVVAEAGARPTTVRWGGLVGTTGWADGSGMKTTRTDWLGARVADYRLAVASGERGTTRSASIAAGDMKVLETVTAESLVEGAVHLESQECVAVHVVAHPGDVPDPLPGYANGDVKWPGWFNGAGYGRAAGLYEGSTWQGRAEAKITAARSAFGWRLLHAGQSPKALVRHGDSAEVLFGGYGVVYEARATLENTTSSCVSADVAFTSYADLAARPGTSPAGERRTPSSRWLSSTDPSKRPSMIWNGPIEIRHQARGGSWTEERRHVILQPTLSQREAGDATAVPAGISRRLVRWDLSPGEKREMVVSIPVPGYIVAPAALTVETTPCGG